MHCFIWCANQMKITTQLKLQASHSMCFIPYYISCIFRVYALFHVIYHVYFGCIHSALSQQVESTWERAPDVYTQNIISFCVHWRCLYKCLSQRGVNEIIPFMWLLVLQNLVSQSYTETKSQGPQHWFYSSIYTHTQGQRWGLSNIISFTFSC